MRRARATLRHKAVAERGSSAASRRISPTSSLLAEMSSFRAVEPQSSRRDVVAAVAAGQRLLAGLSWEWSQLSITPSNWRDEVEENRPDLVLIEVSGAEVPGWGDLESEAVLELATWCDSTAIPLMLWATEGPPPAATGIPFGRSVKCGFVANQDEVEQWRNLLPGGPVEHLAPAASPRLHNPINGGPARRRELSVCVLADARFRSEVLGPQLTEVLDPAIRPISSKIDVFNLGSDHSLPPVLLGRFVGTMPHIQASAALGRYRVLLDVGRASPGSTWSLVEAGASQTAVVTLPVLRSVLPKELADCVATGEDHVSLKREIVSRVKQPELRDREAVRLHRAVLAGHTYTDRVDRILSVMGRKIEAPRRSVSAVVPTNRAHEIENVLANVGRQSHRDVELVLVAHGLRLDYGKLRSQAQDAGIEHVTIVEADHQLSLGSCMNLGVEASSGSYIAKMDDDNYYGRNYLHDLLQAFDYTDAGIVGKWAHYVWLRSTDAVVLRHPDSEHRYERRVQGGSMLFDGDMLRDLRFNDLPRAVDSDILDRAAAAGVKIYSADRYNYVSVRNVSQDGHTWSVGESTFLTGAGHLQFYGDPRLHVNI
jgi:hypothetical protein